MLYRAISFCAFCLAALAAASPAAASGGSASAAMMGSGAAWLDYDNDGDLDLFYMTGKGEVHFQNYNLAMDKFTEVTAAVLPQELINTEQWSVGVACSDLNNDGWIDMFLAMDGPNIVLINDGGVFYQRGGKPAGNYFSSSVAVFDYNRDALPDIFVGNYSVTNKEDNAPNQLFRCDSIDAAGVPHYTEVAGDLGIQGSQRGDFDRTLGVAISDLNDDGWPDIYVGNDFDGVHNDGIERRGWNELFINNGNGTFTDVTEASGARDDNGDAMGVIAADYDDDGDMDLFAANFWEDSLLRNDGFGHGGSFTNVSEAAGLYVGKTCQGDDDTWSYNGWGTALYDYDNDGDKDLHIANGFIISAQAQEEPNQLFENTGNGQFTEVGCAAGIDDKGDARGAAYADFNQDGLLDIIVINNNWLISEEIVEAPTRMLYINQGDGTYKDEAWARGFRQSITDPPKPSPRKSMENRHWIQIELTGRTGPGYSARGCEGARVWVTAGGKTQVSDLGAYSYCSQNSPRLHFGIGEVDMIDEIKVRYPSGLYDVITDVTPDQILKLNEPESTPVRVLSFDLQSQSEGVRLNWSYKDDMDVVRFEISRIFAGSPVKVADIEPTSHEVSYLDDEAPRQAWVTYVLHAVFRNGSREEAARKSVLHNAQPGLTRMVLRPGFPNPFNGELSIPVSAAQAGTATLEVYDAQGRLVRRLAQPVVGGESMLQWDGLSDTGSPVPAGVYFYRLAGGKSKAHRVIRIK